MDAKTKKILFWALGIIAFLIVVIAIIYFVTKKPTVGVNPNKPISAQNPPVSQNWIVAGIQGLTTLGSSAIGAGGVLNSGSSSCTNNLYTYQCNDTSAYIASPGDPNQCTDGTVTPTQLACANN